MWMMAQVSSALKEDTLVILDSCCLSLLFFVIACANLQQFWQQEFKYMP